MEISAIIIEFTPAITAVIGIIVAVVSGFKKIKGHNTATIKVIKENQEELMAEIKDTNAKLIEANEQVLKDNEDLRKENQALRNDINKLTARISKVHFVEREK